MNQPAVTQLQQNVYNLYGFLDQIKAILPLMLNNWQVEAPGISVNLSPQEIQEMKLRYSNLRTSILNEAQKLPLVENLG